MAADIRLDYKIEYTISNGSNHNCSGLAVEILIASKPTNVFLNLWNLGMKGRKRNQHLLSTCYMKILRYVHQIEYLQIQESVVITMQNNNNPMFLLEYYGQGWGYCSVV